MSALSAAQVDGCLSQGLAGIPPAARAARGTLRFGGCRLGADVDGDDWWWCGFAGRFVSRGGGEVMVVEARHGGKK